MVSLYFGPSVDVNKVQKKYLPGFVGAVTVTVIFPGVASTPFLFANETNPMFKDFTGFQISADSFPDLLPSHAL
jgi:hypothetical protein